tara:strand:- start:181 stop:1152 length:972 start_codon:yes stop_codon:yes gene_type:complete
VTEPAPTPPDRIQNALKDATRLEWWTLFWLILIVVMMGSVAGGSQAFRTAWIEDALSLIAPALFLISRRVEEISPRRGFPYGFHRAGTLAFFFAAATLLTIGGYLFYEGASKLIAGEHPTIGSWHLAGQEIWLGWIMMVALILSVIPPVILGRKKRKIGRELRDKILFTDADTNAADWQTGLAGCLGILGVALGFWWSDSLIAVLISISILRDGLRGVKIATTALLDGMPRCLDSMEIDTDADMIEARLRAHYPDCVVQIRETGRYFRVTVEPEKSRHIDSALAEALLDRDDWRLIEVTKAIRDEFPRPAGVDDHKAADLDKP